MSRKLEAPSYEQIKSLSIFGEQHEKVTRSVAQHNVGALLPLVSEELRGKVDSHYGPRAGALDYTRKEIGLVVPEATKRIKQHAEYLGETLGRSFNVYESDALKNGTHPADTLIVPYYNNQETQQEIQKAGQESWGLHPKMVAALKNKVHYHRLIQEANIEGMEVPDHRIANLDNFKKEATELLQFSKDLYSKYNFSDKYPLGLVIRAEESDGNYGQALLRETDDGRVVMTPHGDKNEAQYFRKDEWGQAIDAARETFKKGLSEGSNPDFVISRFLDLITDPGLSVVIKDNTTASLGWNKQLKEKDATACIGTTSFETTDKHTKALQEEFEAKTADDFEHFLRFVAKKENVPFQDLNAVLNEDVMLPGPLEMALRASRGQKRGYYVAEANPRFTNYTDGILAVVGFNQMTPSINSLRTVISDGISMVDRKPLGGAEPEVVRTILFEIDNQAIKKGDSDRAFLRMPDETAGLILTGDRIRAEEKVNHAIELAGGVVYESKGN